MDELIKMAFEVRDALRYCVGSNMGSDCEKCIYYKYDGCVNGLMLDAAKVIERMIEVGGYIDALQIANAPTVDAVEVVRCRDCIMKNPPKKYGDLQCSVLGIPMKDDNFCSYGIRKNSIRKEGDRNG